MAPWPLLSCKITSIPPNPSGTAGTAGTTGVLLVLVPAVPLAPVVLAVPAVLVRILHQCYLYIFRGLPDIYTLIPWASGPRPSGIYMY